MAKPYEYKGQRGMLSLYYEDDKVAIDVTEYTRKPQHPDSETRELVDGATMEMFIHYKDIPNLVSVLDEMRQVIERRIAKRASDAADRLRRAGVSPRDPAEVTALDVRRDASLMESVALFYLQEAADIRNPELPF